jgi:hypothetical protein
VPKLDTAPTPVSYNPLDVLTTAVTPHGYGVGKDGKSTAVTVKVHAPKVKLGEPSREDEETAEDVMALFYEARDYRRPLARQWDRNYRMLYNKMTWSRDRPDWLPSPLVPEIFPVCAALVGWMTDQRAVYTVAPNAIPNTQFFNFFQGISQDLEAALDATFQVNCEENEWTKAIWDSVTYGSGFIKTSWEMTLAGGQGDAISRRVSPYAFYPDPAATSMDDANYFIEAKKYTVQELDRRFPGAADLFPNGGTGGSSDDIKTDPSQISEARGSQPPKSASAAIGGIANVGHTAPGTARKSVGELPGVLVFEAWVREHENYDTRDPQSGEDTTRTYETWRVIVVADGHVLMNEPADNLWSHGKHPYSRLVLWDTGGEFWGHSLVALLTPEQLMINRLLAALQQNVELTGNPVFRLAVNSGAMNSRSTMTNRPGQRLPVGPGDNVSGWLNPPPVNPQMMQLLQHYLQRLEAISGLSAITKGGTPGGRPAQNVVDSLQEAAFVRVRQHLKHLEYAMRDAGYKRASLIVENYTTPRMMAIAGPSGERTSLTLKARHFMVPTSQGGTPMMFALNVDAGSRLHTSRAMREDRAVQLYTLGLIDRSSALSDLGYPNAGDVAGRMDEQEKQAAVMGGAPPGPGQRQRAGRTQ